jgi:hypothetical protein
LKAAARATLQLAESVGDGKRGERWLHGVLLGYLEASVGDMESEYQVSRGHIDLRHGGNNPAVIEFVVRKHGVENAPSMNRSELAKLTRIPNTRARTRYLLIIDTSGYAPLKKDTTQQAYLRWHAGRGRFERQPVRVIYVHPDPRHDFDFSWDPYVS